MIFFRKSIRLCSCLEAAYNTLGSHREKNSGRSGGQHVQPLCRLSHPGLSRSHGENWINWDSRLPPSPNLMMPGEEQAGWNVRVPCAISIAPISICAPRAGCSSGSERFTQPPSLNSGGRQCRLSWEEFLAPGQPVALRVTCHRSRLYHQGAVAERIAGAIADRLGQSPPLQKLSESEEDDEDHAAIDSRAAEGRSLHDQRGLVRPPSPPPWIPSCHGKGSPAGDAGRRDAAGLWLGRRISPSRSFLRLRHHPH